MHGDGVTCPRTHSRCVGQPEFDFKQSRAETDIHNHQIMNLIIAVLDFKCWEDLEMEICRSSEAVKDTELDEVRPGLRAIGGDGG